MDILVCYLLC